MTTPLPVNISEKKKYGMWSSELSLVCVCELGVSKGLASRLTSETSKLCNVFTIKDNGIIFMKLTVGAFFLLQIFGEISYIWNYIHPCLGLLPPPPTGGGRPS